MPRISEATRRWQKRVKELEQELRIRDESLKRTTIDLAAVKAKLERYEKSEQAQDTVAMEYRNKLESELTFLRGLLRDMVISPDTLQALAKNEVRFEESRGRERRRQEKQWRREENERRLNEAKIKKESALK